MNGLVDAADAARQGSGVGEEQGIAGLVNGDTVDRRSQTIPKRSADVITDTMISRSLATLSASRGRGRG